MPNFASPGPRRVCSNNHQQLPGHERDASYAAATSGHQAGSRSDGRAGTADDPGRDLHLLRAFATLVGPAFEVPMLHQRPAARPDVQEHQRWVASRDLRAAGSSLRRSRRRASTRRSSSADPERERPAVRPGCGQQPERGDQYDRRFLGTKLQDHPDRMNSLTPSGRR